jgi:hypothetical protein
MEEFSLNNTMMHEIFQHAKPLGHNEDSKNLNLGFGFLYYGLVRALRPKHIVVIGSGFGFSVVCLALGIKDNDSGALTFVDPAYSLLKDGPLKTVGGNGKWNDPEKVTEHFKKFQVENIVTHYQYRSDQFFRFYEALHLPEIDVAFIDGNHSYRNVKYDFLNTLRHSHKNTYIFLHDTNIYIRELIRHAGVKRWLNVLKLEEALFEIVNFPFSSGVALIRVLQDTVWHHIQ